MKLIGINQKWTSDTGTGGNDGRSRIGSDGRPDGPFKQTALPYEPVDQIVGACTCRHYVPTVSAMV